MTPRTLAPLLLAAALALGLAAPAQAQVVRCTDPATSKVTYTDGECRRGEAAREVEGRKTPEALALEREQAAEALARKYERQQQEALLRPPPTAPAPEAQPAPDPARSPACQRARQQLQQALDGVGQGLYDEQARIDTARRQANLACLSPADFARAERDRPPAYAPGAYAPPVVVLPPRPHPAPPRREITHCNVFRCYDRQGNVYPR